MATTVPATQPAIQAAQATTVVPVSSTNIVNGKAPDTSFTRDTGNGIQTNPREVAVATTAIAPLSDVGNVQQITEPAAASAAANIQNKPVANKSAISPSSLPPALQSISTRDTFNMYNKPSQLPVQAPASILLETGMDAMPQAAMPQAAMPTKMLSGMPSAMSSGMSSAMPNPNRYAPSCSDDYSDDCSDNCNESDSFFNFLRF